MEGIEILDNAITQEINLGINNLPLSEFTHLFKHPSNTVINRSLEMKKCWFSTVRAGRIVYNDTIIQDEFGERGPLQKWVGLSPELFPSKRESQNIETLNKAIQDEYNIGIGQLPTASHNQFFRKSLQEIISLPLQK